MALSFIDFEVFKYNWMCVIIDPINKKEVVIIDNPQRLLEYYLQNKRDVYVGYNIRNYDKFIIQGILTGFKPKEINDFIIHQGRNGWQFSKLLENFPLNIYDVGSPLKSLKQLEAYMGNSIVETSVPFDIDRPLTSAEIQETIKYCRHDVINTIEVFTKRRADFDAHLSLIKTFDLPLEYIGKTQAQLSAIILGCQKKKRNDEWDLQLVDTLQIKKYKHIVEWFQNKDNYNYLKNLEVEVCGVPHIFGWGGLHGCPNEPIHKKGSIIHIDVNSFYPSIMIEYNLLSRNSKYPEKYKEIYEKRLELKRQGKKKEQAPYKIVLNATYGITKDKQSAAYDPRQANNICVNGQLLLLDLLEHLEGHCELIQSNTDGIIIQIEDTDAAFDIVDRICHEWEQRTRMTLGFDNIDWIAQGDVNNYLFKFENGKYERKGAYVKELNELDNDLPIVNKAIVNYITKGVPVAETINNCNEFIAFQKVVKISSKYLYGLHNDKKLTDKTYRVFASKDKTDGALYKVKTGNRIEKFANTPEHTFIYNENVNNAKIPTKLDKQYYINTAIERLQKKFGLMRQQLDFNF